MRGQVKVFLNTTLREQRFDLPNSLLAVLPGHGGLNHDSRHSPQHRRVGAHPEPGEEPSPYVVALIQGSITLFGAVTLTGFLSFTAAGDVVIIAGTVSLNIDYVGALSGTLDLRFYTHHPQAGNGRPSSAGSPSRWPIVGPFPGQPSPGTSSSKRSPSMAKQPWTTPS